MQLWSDLVHGFEENRTYLYCIHYKRMSNLYSRWLNVDSRILNTRNLLVNKGECHTLNQIKIIIHQPWQSVTLHRASSFIKTNIFTQGMLIFKF